jgi:hypothetical protein
MNQTQIENLEAAQAYIKEVIAHLMEMGLTNQATLLHAANHAIIDAKCDMPASTIYV